MGSSDEDSGSSDGNSKSETSSGEIKGSQLVPGASDVSTGTASFYAVSTGSIMAVVGVVGGIVGILAMFAVIGRRKYDRNDDDSPLPPAFNMDGSDSIARLSPTFLHDDSISGILSSNRSNAAYQDTVLCSQRSGISIAAVLEASTVSGWGRGATGGGAAVAAASASNAGAARVPSGGVTTSAAWAAALEASGMGAADEGRNTSLSAVLSSVGSESSDESDSWSSVLVSDCERERGASRNTRDTTLSALTAGMLSDTSSSRLFGSSGHSGRYADDALAAAFSAPDGAGRLARAGSRPTSAASTFQPSSLASHGDYEQREDSLFVPRSPSASSTFADSSASAFSARSSVS